MPVRGIKSWDYNKWEWAGSRITNFLSVRKCTPFITEYILSFLFHPVLSRFLAYPQLYDENLGTKQSHDGKQESTFHLCLFFSSEVQKVAMLFIEVVF